MSQRFALAVAVVAVLAVLSSHASAQTPTLHPIEARLTLPPRDVSELSSINGESCAATTLYISGAVLLGAGGPFVLVAALAVSINHAFGSSDDGTMAVLGLTAGASILGAVLLGVAIGLDVDSGSRRGALERRQHTKLSVGAAPTPGGFAIALSGDF